MRLHFPLVSAILVPALIAAPLCADPIVASTLHVAAKSQADTISVSVTDGSDSAVADAAVAIRLPDAGETGTFPDGTHAAVAYTDEQGEAHFPVIAWSTRTGAVAVKITVTKGAARAGTLFEQKLGPEAAPRVAVTATSTPQKNLPETPVTQPGHVQNSPVASPVSIAPIAQQPVVPMVSITHGPAPEHLSGGSHKKWIILAAVVGVGAGAAFAFSAKKSGSTSSSTSSSTVTIGSPTVSVGAP